MTTSRKTILAIAGAAVLLGACASDPYYNGAYGDRYSYGYGGGPAYYDPYYDGPSVGFGVALNDRDSERWHRDHERDFRGRDRDWDRGDRGDRDGGHDAAGSTGQNERG